jgi:hypothetical protein
VEVGDDGEHVRKDEISGSTEGTATESLVTVSFVRPNLPTIDLPNSFFRILNGIHEGSCSSTISISWQQTLNMVGEQFENEH